MAGEREAAKKEKWSWEIFVACMFMGLGVGMILGDGGPGVIIGMGVGFLLGSFIKIRKRVSISLPRSVGGIALTIIGIGFISLGLSMIGYLPHQILQYAGGIVFVGLGLLLIIVGASNLKKSSKTP